MSKVFLLTLITFWSTLLSIPSSKALSINTEPGTISKNSPPTVKIYQFVQKEELNMTPYRFRAYIKPQLRSINSEFYHILRKIRPELNDFIRLKSQVSRFYDRWKRWEGSCRLLKTDDCHRDLKTLYRRARRIDSKLLEIHEDLIFDDALKKQGKYSQQLQEGVFFSVQTLNEMMTISSRVLHSIEQGLMLGQTLLFQPEPFLAELGNLVHQLDTRSGIVLTNLVPKDHKIAFENFWHHFVKPVEQFVLGRNDPEYLISNLESFNSVINEFHMKLEKGRNRLPSSQRKVTEVMHNRWNTILKVLIRDI